MTDMVASPVPASANPVRRRGMADFIRRLYRSNKLSLLGGLILMLLLFVALTANWLAPYGYNEIDPISALQLPSWEHPFSTDHLGRDVLSRMIFGAQLSVIIAVSAAAASIIISSVIGVVSGYYGGRTDSWIQRFVDAWMSFPDLIVLIAGVAIFGNGTMQVVVLLSVLYGISGSRIVRGAVLSARENVYVHAGQSIGGSDWHVIWAHIVPTIAPQLIVLFTTRLGSVILVESGLSFLGFGVPPPAPSWGGMLSGSRDYMFLNPWLGVFPGLAITVVVFAVNMFGDGIRDVLDPRQRGAGGRLK